ncbi:MAG: hypothetical protein AAGB25_01385 [Pseudomonadota bacterium]
MKHALFTSLAACCWLSIAMPVHAAAPAAKTETIDPLARKITGSPKYMPIFGLRSSITEGFSVTGFLAVDAGLEIPNDKDREKAEATRPRLVDAMRSALATYADRSYIRGEPPNADMIRARLQRAVDRELGPGKASVALASLILFRN